MTAAAADRARGTPRVGLVLGAGGVIGYAFHAGVLRAVHEQLGLDARDAEVVVGTSAGSHVGALLRAGLSPADVAARYSGDRLSPEGAEVVRRMGPPEPIPRPRFRAAGMAAPGMVVRSVLRPRPGVRVGAIAAAALPAGQIPLEPFMARLNWLFGRGWPDRRLWLPAVRLRDGRRVVFGRDEAAPPTDVGRAVAASCAVPGGCRPVVIDGERYVDGGVHSPTNADLLAGADIDLLVVSSPMSVARGAWNPRAELTARGTLRLLLARELRAARRAGVPVLAFQPTAEDLAAMGLNGMDPRNARAVVRQAHASAARRLREGRIPDPVADVLAA